MCLCTPLSFHNICMKDYVLLAYILCSFCIVSICIIENVNKLLFKFGKHHK